MKKTQLLYNLLGNQLENGQRTLGVVRRAISSGLKVKFLFIPVEVLHSYFSNNISFHALLLYKYVSCGMKIVSKKIF